MKVVVSYWWMKWVASIAYRIIGSDKVYSAQSLLCFIILRDASLKGDPVLIRHETIHWKQQLELLVIGHWLLYLGFYFWWLLRLGDHEAAYSRNPFEREAYTFEAEAGYLQRRPPFHWWKFL